MMERRALISTTGCIKGFGSTFKKVVSSLFGDILTTFKAGSVILG